MHVETMHFALPEQRIGGCLMRTTRTTGGDAVRLLLVTPDAQLMRTFAQASKELGISTEWNDRPNRFPEFLTRDKYAGIVIDLDAVADIPVALAQVRESRSNSKIIVVVVATFIDKTVPALEGRTHFLLLRPLDRDAVRGTLEAAAVLMHAEHRRYFRHTAVLPLQITREAGDNVECSTLNVSSGGFALLTPVPLKLGELVEIVLTLPHGTALRTPAIVIWDDNHGKSGLRFYDYAPDKKEELDAWLEICEAETRSTY